MQSFALFIGEWQMRELHQLLADDVDQWFMLGVNLGVPMVALRQIQGNYEYRGLNSWKVKPIHIHK